MTVNILRSRDLMPGDVMLKLKVRQGQSDALSKIIFGLQAASGGQHPYVTHAGVMFDKMYIIEAQQAGLSGNDIRVQNKELSYAVYRCKNTNVAKGAGTAAKMLFDIHKSGKSFSYDLLGAASSLIGTGSGTARTPSQLDDLLENVLVKGKSSALFCSQFVVLVYQLVAVQNRMPANSFLKGSDAKVNPSHLLTLFEGNARFDRMGFMQPGIR